MAIIDKFVKTIYQYQADRLDAISGDRVTLTVGEKTQPLTAKPATQHQIEQLVREIVPEDLAAGLEAEGCHEFAYHAPAGPVTIEVRRTAGSLQIQLVPRGSDDPDQEAVDAAGAEPRISTRGVLETAEAAPGADPVEAASGSGAEPGGETAISEPDGPADLEGSAGSGADAGPAEDQERRVSTSQQAAIGKMEELFMTMVERSCSDLHMATGNPPLFRKDGEIVPLLETAPLSGDRVKELLLSITPAVKQREFEACHDTDFAYEVPGLARFRCNLFMDRLGIGGVFRFIPAKIPSVEDLGLTRHVLDLCYLNKGLVLVTGPTGSGKSTTLAALIDHINRNRTAHIITIEDPIEFVHPNRKCLINQREVGSHTDSFKKALRAALREDPDIVLVGEMRDLETIAIAIETAETGHLVFGTLHTTTAPSTVDRIIDQFPADRQSQIRTMLSESLKAVISQTLCKKIGGGRVAALELLFVNLAVSNLIREAKTFQIPSIMQTGKSLGMMTLNDVLVELVKKKIVNPMEAYAKSIGKAELKAALERNGFKLDVP